MGGFRITLANGQSVTPIIRAPKTADEWQAYYHLRWEVLRQPWQQPEGSEKDELEEDAFHFAAFDNSNTIIGVARLHLQDSETGQVRYMAVLPLFRGQGIGRQLLQAIEARAASLGLDKIVLNARENAVRFYQQAGYSIIKPAHTLYGVIPHFLMSRQLNG